MAIPTWSVGEVLTAADVNDWFVPVEQTKHSDQGPVSTTALANDNDLVLAVAASADYIMEGYLVATGNTLGTGDIKIGLTVPSGAAYRFTTTGYSLTSSATLAMSAARTSGTASQGVDGGAGSPVWIRGRVKTSTTAGSLTLQWAANTAGGTGTTVLTDSWLMLRRVG